MSKSYFDLQRILRWITIAIVLMVAVILLGLVLKVAGVLLNYVLQGLLILFVVALILRFLTLLQDRRR